MRARGARFAVLLLLLLLTCMGLGGRPATAAPTAPASAASEVSSVPAAPPPTLVSDTPLDARMHDLVFTTAALPGRQVHVRVLLPTSYAASPAKRFPVLLLLDGCCNPAPQAPNWTTMGNAEALTAGADVIVVMPDCGTDGWYADWPGGGQDWETFHVGQLLPWIDGHYRTVGGRAGHAVAGLSMGGFGAMSYAARHPDDFVAAASFSGAVDVLAPKSAIRAPQAVPPDAAFGGSRGADEIAWRARNPVDLAGNLAGLSVTLRTGNGQPGGDGIEQTVNVETHDLATALTAAGVPHTLDDYGPGTHTWPFWQRDLTETLPVIMAAFAAPPAPPDPFSYAAVEPDFGAYGYAVRLARAAPDVAALQQVRAAGFSLRGAGTADVTTAARYAAGRDYALTESDAAGTRTVTEAAGGDGRLAVHLNLGAAGMTASVAIAELPPATPVAMPTPPPSPTPPPPPPVAPASPPVAATTLPAAPTAVPVLSPTAASATGNVAALTDLLPAWSPYVVLGLLVAAVLAFVTVRRRMGLRRGR